MGSAKRRYVRFSLADREFMSELWNVQKLNASKIAKAMGLSRDRIGRELRRGFTGAKDEDGRDIYDSLTAEAVLEENARVRTLKLTRTKRQNRNN